MNLNNKFMDRSSQAKETNAKINHWDYTKIKKNFCTAKKTINKMNRQSPEWEKYLQMTSFKNL